VHIHFLGQSELSGTQIPLQAKRLLGRLIAVPGSSRDQLITDLWDEDPSPVTHNRLRVALFRLRAALGQGAVAECEGRLSPAAELLADSDVGRFQATASLLGRPQADLAELQAALELYGGDFLPEEAGAWAEAKRSELRSLYVQLQLVLAERGCAEHSCRLAVRALSEALRTDPFLGEDLHQQLIACLSVVDGKYAAVAQYRRFLDFLQRELQERPMPETVALVEQIKAGTAVCIPIRLRQESCPYVASGRCGLRAAWEGLSRGELVTEQ
jgi:DNA-binding SARP family transcriptional activator